MRRLCQVFRSPRREEMYLYVDQVRGLEDVPAELLQSFGEPEPVLALLLEPSRRLARVDAGEVLDSIEQRGYFLQMPPTPAELARRETAGSGGEDANG